MDGSKPDQQLISDLSRAKALFQLRSIQTAMGMMPPGSKGDQENRAAQSEGEA